MFANIEIIIGTYEEFLLGYRLSKNNGKPTLTQSFADKSHSGSIRCLAVHGRWVASGGTDDRIFIYDMGARKQSQILLSHEGTINSMAFTPDGTHLLSGGEEGRMIATRLKTWFTDATWKKAHNGSAVTHITCHPSGKLALSLGTDLILRTWNLVKGRVAYKTNLKSRNSLGSMPECLSWSPSGDYFAITGQRLVEFWSIKTADVVRTHKTKSKPVCLTWLLNDECLIGLEDGKILWLSTDNAEEKEIAAHNARVKAMCSFNQNLVSASSSGEIKLWQITEKDQNLKEIATTNIGCRPTCISILDLEQFGDNYTISSTLEIKDNDTITTFSRGTIPERGVVTIEYYDENSDEKVSEEEDENNSNEDERTENDGDNIAEDDSNDDYVKSHDEVGGDDDSSGDNSDNSSSEPVMHLPMSRKHKLQVAKNQEHAEKRQKFNKNKQKISEELQSQQKKNKLKYK